MKKGKDRLSRIASQKAGTPFSLRKDKPYLMLSDVTIAFEAEMLKVGNYLNAHLHSHVKSYVEELYGRSAVELVVPPLVVFDMLQSSLNSLVDGGYAAHDDSGTFVTDNNLDYGDEDHNMIVMTFFWTNRDDVPTNVTWHENGQPHNKRTIATMQGGGHLQTYGVQGNKKHFTEPPTKRQRATLNMVERPERVCTSSSVCVSTSGNGLCLDLLRTLCLQVATGNGLCLNLQRTMPLLVHSRTYQLGTTMPLWPQCHC